MKTLHSIELVHGNIKAANVLLGKSVDNPIYLVDPSAASTNKQASHDYTIGSTWITPECASEKIGREPLPKDDIYALGALTKQLLAQGSEQDSSALEFVRLCTEADLAQRFQSMEQVLSH